MGCARDTGTWGTRGVRLAGTTLGVVLVLAGCAPAAGDGGSRDAAGAAGATSSASAEPRPSESYAAPEDWIEPERWVALPRGQRTDDYGSEVGFPHTTEGAVAMLAAANTSAIEGSTSNKDEQLRLYYSYIGKPDQSEAAAERVELGAIDNGKVIAREMGLKPGAPMPPGAYMRSHVIGFQFIRRSAEEVTVWLLAREVQKSGEMAQEEGSYTRTLLGAQWQGDDWKLSVLATRHAQDATDGKPRPKMAAPGDAAFNAAGWTAIREAS